MNASSSTSNLNSLLRENVTGNRNESKVRKAGPKQRRGEKIPQPLFQPQHWVFTAERHILARRAKIGFDKSAVCSHLKPPVCNTWWEDEVCEIGDGGLEGGIDFYGSTILLNSSSACISYLAIAHYFKHILLSLSYVIDDDDHDDDDLWSFYWAHTH